LKKFINLFFILTVLVFSSKTSLVAKEISGSLSEGEGSSFIPIRGAAFSIISDVTSGIRGGNYNILIKSGGRIIYKEDNQLDDLYLVFNEPVDKGDIIKLDVNKGIFLFKMSPMETLPDVIVDAIKEQAPREYKELKPLHNRHKRASSKKTVHKKEKKQITKSKPIEKKVFESSIDSQIDTAKIQEPVKVKKEPGFFDSFSKKIDEFIHSKPKDEKAGTSLDTSTPTDIGNLSSSIDSAKKDLSSTIKSKKREISSSAIKSDIDKIAQTSRVKSPKTSTSDISSLPTAKTFPLDLERVKSPVGVKSSFPTPKTELESFSKCTPPAMSSSQVGSFKTKISNGGNVQQPKFQKQGELVEIKEIKLDEEVPQFRKEESVVTQPVPQKQPYKQPEVVEKPSVVQKVIEPKVQEKVIVIKDEKPKDRIVITKMIAVAKKKSAPKEESRVIKRHIQPEEYKKQQKENIPDRMSDRVIGGGIGLSTGSLKVKAYSNNRPVSAWVEVFRADTKKRVKTFYTGKGRTLQDIKLPAGVYVIKATYRTAGSKRKKTIGRIQLKEGESINRKITFNDGSIIVKVKKGGKPIYAKVEVYKKGKRRRIAYEFTSKINGMATLSLGSGDYDIVVRDHNNVKRFNSITVRGGKAKTIHANF
jgi:hypothetical protein